MAILDGGIQSLFGTVMGSFYLDATLISTSQVYDDQGGTTETTTTQPVKVQEDMVTEANRAAGGFSQNEKQFFVLQKGVAGPLTGDSRLTIAGITYALREPQQDPAKSYWQVRGVPV